MCPDIARCPLDGHIAPWLEPLFWGRDSEIEFSELVGRTRARELPLPNTTINILLHALAGFGEGTCGFYCILKGDSGSARLGTAVLESSGGF